jgi:two-component system, NtrC family, sensor kinase
VVNNARWSMRFGVSTKILIAYAVLLGMLAASSLFTLLYLRRGRQELEANQRRLEVQVAVDASLRSLEDFAKMRAAEGSSSKLGLTSRVVAQNGIASARQNLRDALDAINRYLNEATYPSRREEFEGYRHDIVDLDERVVGAAAALGASELAAGDGNQADRRLANLLSRFHGLKNNLRAQGKQIAEQLSDNERRAVEIGFVLSGLGLVLAVAAALVMVRTLRPLRVLREHTRQIAGGDYARRTGIASRDEIGDLAREFDAMAAAIEEREHKLIRSERLATVGRMAAHITHEIRNPLASLGLNVELLSDEVGADNAEARKLVTSIGNEIDRLSDITETYLRFVRLPKPKLEREDLGAIATSVLEFAGSELKLAGVTWNVRLEPGVLEVAVDESQLRQSLLNLVRNAKEAMPSGGRIEVEVGKTQDGMVRLVLADSGAGIPRENLDRIFEPFFSTKTKGTGLGLALVQQIVLEHGGRIEVDCPESGGTRFTIFLPAAKSSAVDAGESVQTLTGAP